MKAPSKLIVLTAPSGAGKTTIAQKLMDDFPQLRFSTSATTRKPRDYEEDGLHYYFLSDAEFDQTIQNGGFLEWENYSGNKYGTLQSDVDRMIEKGYIPLLDIEINGALNVKKKYGGCCTSIFIQPPSFEELKRRLENRGSETNKTITQRLEQARKELSYAESFDFNVVNDHLEEDYLKVKEIVESFISDS